MKINDLKGLVTDKFLKFVNAMEKGHLFEDYDAIKNAIIAITFMEDNPRTDTQEIIISEHFMNKLNSL